MLSGCSSGEHDKCEAVHMPGKHRIPGDEKNHEKQ